MNQIIAITGDRALEKTVPRGTERAGAAPTANPGSTAGAALACRGGRRIYAFLRAAVQVARAVLREVFDESAYDRYLKRTQKKRSVASYREFLQEQQVGIARKPRCC